MLKPTDLDALMASTAARDDVLCVYLNVDPTASDNHRTPPAFEIWARRALADLEASHAGAGHDFRMRLRDLVVRVNEFVASHKVEGKGLAVFAGDNLWEAIELPVAFENQLGYGQPNLAPLLEVVGEQAPYGLVQVDHRQARWITAWLGRPTTDGGLGLVLDTSQWSSHDLMPAGGDGPGGTGIRAGSNREAFEQRVDEHTRTFYRQVAEQLGEWLQATALPAMIIGGNEEAVVELKQQLPPDVARRVVGTLSLPNYVPDAELLERAAPLALQHAQAASASMVNEVVDLALAGGAGAVGPDDVLAAVQRSQARTVYVQRPLDATAWQCRQCDTVFGQAVETCTQCGGAVEACPMDSLLPLLVRRTGAELRFVSGPAAVRLYEFGGMAALLRFV